MDNEISKYELIATMKKDIQIFMDSESMLYLKKDSYSTEEYDRMLTEVKDDLKTRLLVDCKINPNAVRTKKISF
ncbi:hypothetical protein, partial [Lactiplantibacillus plantarum]